MSRQKAKRNPPYPFIADELAKGRVIPFLGAGANVISHKLVKSWKLGVDFLPSGKELSRFIADQVQLPSTKKQDREDLAKVTSYFVEVESGVRQPLRDALRRVFNSAYKPTDIHNCLASMALRYDDKGPARPDPPGPGHAGGARRRETRGTALLIVTTNYDDLMEQALQAQGCPYDLVIYPSECKEDANSVLWWKDHGHRKVEGPLKELPNKLLLELDKTNVIYKMHGSIHRPDEKWDNFVITEEDYIDFLSRMSGTAPTAVPSDIMRNFRGRRFLFLGYSLNDWNLRVVLRNLRNVLWDDVEQPAAVNDQRLKSWAIQFKPSPVEVKLWEARNVNIYDQDINTFARGLCAGAGPAAGAAGTPSKVKGEA